MPFPFIFFLDTYDLNVGVLNIVPEVFEAILVSFNSFSLYSVLLRLFPPFYLPGLLSILLPQLLYCWFPLVYFQSWLFHCWLFNSSRSLLNSSYIFLINPSSLSVSTFCFQGFGSSLLSLFLILFQVDSLFLPHLFGLVGFYFGPSPTAYFSDLFFCLVRSAWGLLSSGWKVMVPLNCGVFPHWWGWTSALWRFPGWGDLCLCSGGWNWISSLWTAMLCPVVCFGWLWVQCGFG